MHTLNPKKFIVPLLLAVSFAFAAPATDLPFGAWTRASNEPILSPRGTTWNRLERLTLPFVFHNGKFVMLYRRRRLWHLAPGLR